MSSWLSALGKIAANVVPAVFTGGASLPATLAATGAQTALGALGSGLGGVSQAKASNRGTQFEGQTDLARLLMDRDKQYQDMSVAREQEGRTEQTDAFRKLLSAQHVLSPSAQTHLSTYSTPGRVATDAERGGADALTQQVLARLQGGNAIAPVTPRDITGNDAAFRVDPNLLNAGKGEQITGWLSALLPGLGAALGARQGPPVMSGIPPNGAPRP